MNEDTLKQLIENEGVNFYDSEIANENGQSIYRIYITHKDGITLDICAKISNILSPLLDLNPPMKGKYFLEVSSPGIERKLKKPKHFMASIGDDVEITLINTDKIIAKLVNADENSITLQEDEQTHTINYSDIYKSKTYVQW